LKLGFPGWLLFALAGLVGTAPASLVNWLFVDTSFCLIGSRGSLWSGKAWLASRGSVGAAIPIAPLSWYLSWHDGPAIELTTPEGTGEVRWGIAGVQADLPPFLADLSALPLPPTLAGSSPLGRLRGISGHFDCTYRVNCQGQAVLRIESLSLGLFPADRLGDVAISIDARETGQSAQLTADGKAALTGEVLAQRQNGRISVTSGIQATAGASPGLTRALASLKADGTNMLSFGKRWLDSASGPP
jgi:hypothetical protein